MKNKGKEIRKNLKKAHKEFRQERWFGNPLLKGLVDINKEQSPYLEIVYQRYKSASREILVNYIVSVVFFIFGILELLAGLWSGQFSLMLSLLWIYQNRTIYLQKELLSEIVIKEDDMNRQQQINRLVADELKHLDKEIKSITKNKKK